MTAVIGVMNKHAIAIAADSAVTVSGTNGSKVYNTANKIFTLSKFHPVSIIIYNNANLMLTPWEIIIKLYRDQLGDKEFPHLRDYSENFFEFLKKKDYFTNEKAIHNIIYTTLNDLIKNGLHKSMEEVSLSEENLITMEQEKRNKLFSEKFIEILDLERNNCEHSEALVDFKDFTREEYDKTISPLVDKVYSERYSDFSSTKKSFHDFFYSYILSKQMYGQWTGLVFAGYGEDEIYPVTISTKVANVFNERLRYYTERIEEIDDDNNGSIMPFAQRDVIDTLISGVSPEINTTLINAFSKVLTQYNELLINFIRPISEPLADKIESLDIDPIFEEFIQHIEEFKRNKHIDPTVSTVSVLSKEDLTEMAESLIYLTYLKRRISSDEESVGGPVDVAVISKGDGFIWIKRKNYFKSEQNPHFLNNYFK
ncbi:hypothetical protein [Nonlabens marinus]|uniref:Uncharacterized protein n=1 Tax=Nonlabens marinus S1-08 TaxID=1454201 RepID=W8VP90_9FLAO|nr:hypothetical protein [Nonlabens marinus]BAO54904.1 hypothetical protein NMS_0895 [Nonlabens marinus S1-08]